MASSVDGREELEVEKDSRSTPESVRGSDSKFVSKLANEKCCPCIAMSCAECCLLWTVIGLSFLTLAIVSGSVASMLVYLLPTDDFQTPEYVFGENMTDLLLTNPGRGMSTWDRTHDYETGVVYFREYWKDVEPTRGNIDWTSIDWHLDIARQDKKLIGYRVMPTATTPNDPKTPQWLRDLVGESNGRWENGCWYPDHNNPTFMAESKRLVEAIAARLNGHPLVAFVDIGSVGFWGEWHIFRTDYLPNSENRKHYIDWYFDAFPDTDLVMLTESSESLSYAMSLGAGMRADCLGDWGLGWNHMIDRYPARVATFGDAWKNRGQLVLFETCWDLDYQVQQGWNMTRTFSDALEWHTTSLNNKDGPIPNEIRQEFREFSSKLGYRVVLDTLRLTVTQRSTNRHTAHIVSSWRNVGVAPLYMRHTRLAWRLWFADNNATAWSTPDLNSPNVAIELNSTQDVATWLPGGPISVDEELDFVERRDFTPSLVHLHVCMGLGVENGESWPIGLPILARKEDDGCYVLF